MKTLSGLFAVLGLLVAGVAGGADARHMFSVPGLPDDPAGIDWAAVPSIQSERAVVFRARPGTAGYNMHAYLARHDNRFWAMWSSGLEREDMAGQQVRYAVSPDGLRWKEGGIIAPSDPAGETRLIARGFWVRDDGFFALAARDEAWELVDGVRQKGKYFGPGLQLHYYRFDPRRGTWSHGGVISDNAINNFPPQRLPSGEWMMACRDHDKKTSMLIGGIKAIDAWQVYPLPGPDDGHEMDEPHWWPLPDGMLAAHFRDGSRSFRLYRAFSLDTGRTWTAPVRTDFPDGRAKFNSVRLRDGRHVLACNPRPGEARIPLCLSVSHDGLVFTKILRLLDGPTEARHPNRSKHAGYQYPHLVEAGDFLFVAYSLNQEDIEIVRVAVEKL